MILIAGGAGYIGSHANKILNKRGYETIVYDNLSRGHREFAKWGHFVLGDLADKEQLRLCFKTYPIEAVMHYCAFCYVGESVEHPSEYYRNNVRTPYLWEINLTPSLLKKHPAVLRNLLQQSHNCLQNNSYQLK